MFFLVGYSPEAAALLKKKETTVTQPIVTGDELRKSHRAAVGLAVGGAAGLFGFEIDLNLSPLFSFGVGVGQGAPFQSYFFNAKHYLMGESFWPYVGLGYSRWYTVGPARDKIDKTTPNVLAERLLNDQQKSQGYFSEDLLIPSLGIQFVQLRGDWAGFAAFCELTVLIDIGDFLAAPTGTVGMLYYF